MKICLCAALVLLVLDAARAAAPRFDPPVFSGGAISLTLRGDTGKSLRIEASSNLVEWAEIAAGTPLDGTLRITNDGPAGTVLRYFRGREVERGTPYPSVTPQAGSLTAATLITPERGGLLQIFTPTGAAFTLDIPTNAVLRPTLARMTLLTNLVGLPAVGGLLGAVRLDPEGLVLASPTFLECTFPTNLPRARVASFGFDHDGRQLHLSPDLVGTNRIRMLVNQFRGYGSALFTLAEVEALLAAGPPPQSLARPNRGVRPQATLEECYPEEEAEAKALNEELTEAIRPMQEEIAGELAIERQRQLLGVEDEEPGSNAVAEAMAKGARWYEENIQPRIAGAMQKCLVGRELLIWMLGWERQRQLLGVDSGNSAVSEIAGLLTRCEEQILECCRTRGADRRLVIALLGIERQRQLFGGGGGSWSSDLEACLPQWYGEVRITENLRTSYDRSDGEGEISRGSEVKTFELSAYVDSAEEEISEPIPIFGIPGFTNIIFKLSGLALGAHTVADDRASLPICPGSARSARGVRPHDPISGFRTQLQWSSAVSNIVNLELTVLLSDDDAGIFAPKTSLTFIQDTLEAPTKGTRTEQQASSFGGDCEVETKVSQVTGNDLFIGTFVNVGRDKFTAMPREIRYTENSTTPDGGRREIQIHLQRRN